ncbi:MAG: sigma-70 family RNA polymerase sigma factor [Candidatus Shapirobacteria bacterium]
MIEKKLINQILQKKPGASIIFYQKFEKKVTNYVLGRIDNPKDAEEIVQDTFWAAHNSLSNFQFQCSLSTFLISIAKHEIADYYRKKRIKTILFSHFPFLEVLASKALTPEEEALKSELKQEIIKILERLPKRYQKLIRLKYFKEYSIKEIAVKLATSPKAVESALSRARRLLRRILLKTND